MFQKRADLLDALIGCENNEPVIENQNDIAAKVNSRKGQRLICQLAHAAFNDLIIPYTEITNQGLIAQKHVSLTGS